LNISVIIFSYNEAGNIKGVIDTSFNVLSQLADNFEIIVVDDGSTDGTTGVVSPYLQKPENFRYIKHQKNAGIGIALRTGYEAARNEFVCAIPGDGQFDVHELLGIKSFSNGNFYSFYRPQTNYSLYRSVLNQANRQFNRILLGIRLKDVNWIKVYRKEQLEFVAAELKSSVIESEICAKLIKAGAVPVELPSVYHERKAGLSKGGSWKTLKKVLLEMYALFRVTRRFKKKYEKPEGLQAEAQREMQRNTQ
jgi:glycosyltransferase involved in cell wall biosynthesis